ncbi:MAG: glycosyltransferase family 2 protein [Thalassobaculum sp.]|uniref:glycosyltransferase family 2 protein n=1 Tax=Thalassobaculum sp. TaxID=2022740 RepID=UPI0032EF34F1
MTDAGDNPPGPLSVVVPVCDEADSIPVVLRELLAKAGAAYDLDVVVVDDGSRDGSAEVVAAIAAGEPRVRLIRHKMRCGKSAALRTGVAAARNRWVGMIDGDGENDPDDLVAMAGWIDTARIGAVGLVAGNRRRRTAGPWRLVASRIANGIRRRALQDDCPDTACGLKVIPRDLFLALPYFDSLHRYMPALVRKYGFDVLNVPVDDRPRISGQSKYTNLRRALVGVVDLLGVYWLLRRTSVGALPFARDGDAE